MERTKDSLTVEQTLLDLEERVGSLEFDTDLPHHLYKTYHGLKKQPMTASIRVTESRTVEQRLVGLEQRVSALEGNMFYKHAVMKEIGLPDFLYKTWHVLKRGPVTASEMSAITERKRAVESKYLNMLAAMGLARKQRNGRKVVFTLIQESKSA